MWVIFALAASAFWGLSYVFHEQVYRHLSIYSTIAVHATALAVTFILLALGKGVLKDDLGTIVSSPKVMALLIASVSVFMLAELFIALSIVSKNATLAGLIEISYPVFIALFAYLIFRESELNTGVTVGGAIIMLGVAVVFWFGK